MPVCCGGGPIGDCGGPGRLRLVTAGCAAVGGGRFCIFCVECESIVCLSVWVRGVLEFACDSLDEKVKTIMPLTCVSAEV